MAVHPAEAETKLVIDPNYPTPNWVRWIVRSLTWITGSWAILITQINLADFGLSLWHQFLILKYMAVFSFFISVVARTIGVKPVNLLTKDKEE